MADLRAFRKANKLKQKDLAKYLNTTCAFISMVETGASKLPPEKLSLLLNNTQGWETSMLVGNGGIYAGNNNGGSVNVQIGQNRSGDSNPSSRDASTQIAVLEKENQMLREQIEFMKSLIPSQQKQ
jgi:transcriptional regulator with XRE-family HTH domain